VAHAAEILGLPPALIKSRTHCALHALHDVLEDRGFVP
jgi:hypothetical protein